MEEEVDNVELTRECRHGRRAFKTAVFAGETPERIITEYDPIAKEARADWDYEGVKQGKDDTSGFARDRWIVAHGGKPIFG